MRVYVCTAGMPSSSSFSTIHHDSPEACLLAISTSQRMAVIIHASYLVFPYIVRHITKRFPSALTTDNSVCNIAARYEDP